MISLSSKMFFVILRVSAIISTCRPSMYIASGSREKQGHHLKLSPKGPEIAISYRHAASNLEFAFWSWWGRGERWRSQRRWQPWLRVCNASRSRPSSAWSPWRHPFQRPSQSSSLVSKNRSCCIEVCFGLVPKKRWQQNFLLPFDGKKIAASAAD